MSKMSRDKFLESVENNTPRTHQVEQAILDGKISRDGIKHIVDIVSSVDDDGVTRVIKNVSHKTCDFGHLQDQKTKFLSKCQHCGLVTCDTEFCGYTCQRCGRAFCRRHVSVYSDGQAYCSACKWYKHLMIAFDLVKKVVK